MTIRLRALSLGLGVQSSTIALMAAHGEIEPMPDCAIFANTKREPRRVYEQLQFLRSGNVLPFPIYEVSAGDILENVRGMAAGERWATIPSFVRGGDGKAAPLMRQCTKEFKVEPIHDKVREILGFAPGQSFRHALGIGPHDEVPVLVEMWIGISRDEQLRVKTSEHEWIRNRYPLIEKRMTRRDCEVWLTSHGYDVPEKSACIFCGFAENERWRRRKDDPEQWPIVQEVASLIANGVPGGDEQAGTQPLFLHRSLQPIDKVDFTDLFTDAGGFNNDCGGGCGL
jgi:hypothetical protein